MQLRNRHNCPSLKAYMKKILFVFLLFTFFSCRKNEIHKSIVGNWELRKEVGGIAGTINYPIGNGNMYSFTSRGNFQQSYKGLVQDEGTYSLSPVALTKNWYLKLKSTRNNYETVDSISVESNKLIFLPKIVCCDFPATTYEKLSN